MTTQQIIEAVIKKYRSTEACQVHVYPVDVIAWTIAELNNRGDLK